MAWTTYKGVNVPDVTTSDAGTYLADDVRTLADRVVYAATADPTTTNDTTQGFAPGSEWLNTSTLQTWQCISAATGAAIWTPFIKVASGSVTFNGVSSVTASPQVNVPIAKAASVGLAVQAATSQTANLQEWRNSSGSAVTAVDQNGALVGEILFRQGTAASLATVVLAQGQAGYATDTGMFAVGDGTNIFPNLPQIGGLGGSSSSLILSAKQAIQADAGGSPRGLGSVDLQTVRSSASQVAYGTASFVVGENCTAGFFSTASGYLCGAGDYATASGNGCIASLGGTASGSYSTASGIYSAARCASTAGGAYSTSDGNGTTASGYYSSASGLNSTASGYFSAASGYHSTASKSGQFARAASPNNQHTITSLAANTSNTAATELTTDATAPLGTTEPKSNRFLIVSPKTYACLLTIACRTSTGGSAYFVRQVLITNVSGTVAVIGSVTTIGTDVNALGVSLTVQADNTNKSLQILVTGLAATNIRWRATVTADEISY